MFFVFVIFFVSCKEIKYPVAHKLTTDIILNPGIIYRLKSYNKNLCVDSIMSYELKDSLFQTKLINKLNLIFENNLKDVKFIDRIDTGFTSEGINSLKQQFNKQIDPQFYTKEFDGFYELYYFKKSSGVFFTYLRKDTLLFLFNIEPAGNALHDMW